MAWWNLKREERMITSIPGIERQGANFLQVYGLGDVSLPSVTIDSALTVPAFLCGASFLSRTLAALPFHAFKSTEAGPERITGKLAKVVHENWNTEQDGFKARQYFWQQVFTGGRGLAWIERNGPNIEAIWPMDPRNVTITRTGMQTTYTSGSKRYPAADIIDVPFMLKPDGLGHYGPVQLGAKAIQLALAMNDYGSNFFAGGGVPPLAVEGPLPTGVEAMKRAMADINRAIDSARQSSKPLFPMPPGHKLTPVGFDPDKGQMVEARRFQVEEIARVLQLPPAFLQDLTHGTFSNVEQQDLHLTKHVIGQWAAALEGEMNLKLFGRMNNNRYVEHNLDGLMRGDFSTRMEGLSKGIQNGILMPDEARALENRQPAEGGDKLYIQGATVPLGSYEGASPPANGDVNAA